MEEERKEVVDLHVGVETDVEIEVAVELEVLRSSRRSMYKWKEKT